MEKLQKTLNRLKIEDFIWVIYFFIIAFALYSNVLERDYILHHNKQSRKKFHEINTTIFIVTLIIYLYFSYTAYEQLKEQKRTSQEKLILQQLAFIGSILFLIGGAIYLYVEIKGNDDEEEVAIE